MRKFIKLILSITIICIFIISCAIIPEKDKDKDDFEPPVPTTPPAAGEILITEVGSCPFTNISSWIEIYNNSGSAKQLSDLKFRTYGRYNYTPYDFYGVTTFDLPSLIISPGEFVLIRSKSSVDYPNGSQVVYIANSSSIVPNWISDGTATGSGFTELLYNGNTIDFVRFGSNTESPVSSSHWGSGAAGSLPAGTLMYGYSIARDISNTDTDTAGDWTLRDWATPGGLNDVTSNTDDDNDGIPDCAEDAPGSTFAGLPVYEWGARTGQTDIFIHVDYMNSSDPGVIPQKNALTMVKNAFLNNPGTAIYIHFDAGNLFHPASGSSPADYDLDDKSHQVPFSQAVALGVVSGKANVYQYKNNYMDIAKRQIFHYLLMAYSQNADGSSGSSGVAEINGNDFVCSLGNWGLNTSGTSNANRLINYQASTIMHEFGHNLGLRHGGNINTNYMPNYYSIMNYMYQLRGLPVIGNNEGDRYYYYQKYVLLNTTFNSYLPAGTNSLINNCFGTSFIMNYSNGSGNALDENSLTEPLGLRRTGSAGIDFNGDLDAADAGISVNLNSGEDGVIGTLSDFNDWANINLFFSRYFSGNNSGAMDKKSQNIKVDPIYNDRQEIHTETLTFDM